MLLVYAFIFSPIVLVLFQRLADSMPEEDFKKRHGRLIIVLFIFGFVFAITKININLKKILTLSQFICIILGFFSLYYSKMSAKSGKIDIFLKEKLLLVIVPLMLIIDRIKYLLK